MKTSSFKMFVILGAWLTLLFFLGSSAAMGEEREDETDQTKTAAKMVPKKEYQKIPAGWMVVQGRYGMTTTSLGGEFKFDEVPETSEADKTSSFNSSLGWMQTGGVDFYFFPTDGRRFMLCLSGEHQAGTFALAFDEEDYAYEVGLDSKLVEYYQTNILLGLGYRWIRGPRFQHAASLYWKFGTGNAGMAIDGFANSWGWAGATEIGMYYMYRFENRMHMGFQFDLRGYASYFPRIKFDDNENETNAYFGGGMGVLSIVMGWETR
jgi:hypothetical protein